MILDAHLDLAMNALEWNRDLSRPIGEIREREAGLTDKRDRGNGTVSFGEMRRGGVRLCVATLIANHLMDVLDIVVERLHQFGQIVLIVFQCLAQSLQIIRSRSLQCFVYVVLSKAVGKLFERLNSQTFYTPSCRFNQAVYVRQDVPDVVDDRVSDQTHSGSVRRVR